MVNRIRQAVTAITGEKHTNAVPEIRMSANLLILLLILGALLFIIITMGDRDREYNFH